MKKSPGNQFSQKGAPVRTVRLAIIFFSVCAAAGCRTQSVAGARRFRPDPLDTRPISADVLRGQHAVGAVPGLPMPPSYVLVYDKELEAYLRKIQQLLVAQLPRYGLRFRYEIFITSDPVQRSAFAVGGGYSLISLELLVTCQSPDAVAGVIGHEMAHNALRHISSMNRLLETLTSEDEHVRKALAPVTGFSPEELFRREKILQSWQSFTSLAMLLRAREHEWEADLLGLQLAVAAGFDGNRLCNDFYEILTAGLPPGTRPPENGVHPHPLDRCFAMLDELAQLRKPPRNPMSLDMEAFKKFSQRVQNIWIGLTEPEPEPTPVPPPVTAHR